MKVVAILTLVISTSLSARISDRGGHLLDVAIQERPREKPNGSFDIQLNGGHISRVDFGFQDSQPKKPRRAQSRSNDHHISSSNSRRQPSLTHQSTVNRSGLFPSVVSNRPIRNSQPTSKRPFITHKALNSGRPSRPQKQNGFNGSTFKINRPQTNVRRDHRSSSPSIPSHFTIQPRRNEKSINKASPSVLNRPISRVTPHSHFNPPVVERPNLRDRPHNHFNLPVIETPFQREKPKAHSSPPIVDRQVQQNRPASAHFRPATFHFGAPPSSKSSRRPENSQRISHPNPTTRRPETTHRPFSIPTTRRPFLSHRSRTTQRPSNIIRNKSASRSKTGSNTNSNRSTTAHISSHLIPKGVKPSKFVPPSTGKGDIDEFGPSGNSIQTPVISPNLPSSAKDIPPIFYPIKPKIFPSKRVKM